MKKVEVKNISNIETDRLRRHGLLDVKMAMPNGDLLEPGKSVVLERSDYNLNFLEYFTGLGALIITDYEEKPVHVPAPPVVSSMLEIESFPQLKEDKLSKKLKKDE